MSELHPAPKGQPIKPDILIADFEAPDYGAWTTTGEAFGDGPWRRPGDEPLHFGENRYILGQEGRGLAASVFHNGEPAMGAPTGTLTSPDFIIERDYINLLMGGGWYPGRTCVDLLIDGKTIYSDTGNGCGYGVHQADYLLEWFTWDVGDYSGETARIRLVDNFNFPTGCILVDRIIQSDVQKVDPVDLTPYHETYRPQFHFTADKGWINDPCGVFLYNGEYHLCFQHTSYDEIESALFSPVIWGHAVSKDLVHWQQLPDAIRCEESFHWPEYPCLAIASDNGKPSGHIMSGSSIVDVDNEAGLQQGEHPAILSFYTYPGDTVCGQCMAYSIDGGQSWTKYPGNPVLPGPGVADRDPRVFKYDGAWYMALSHAWGPHVDRDQFTIHLYESDNLLTWRHLGEIPSSVDFCECPDIFPMPVDGNSNNVKWVLVAGDGKYQVGRFDGKMFHHETGPFRGDYGHNHLATQTWFDSRRRIQIAWMPRGGRYRHMPFNQQLTFPRELTLKSTNKGPMLFKSPVQEIASIRRKEHHWADVDLRPGENPLSNVSGDLFDILLDIDVGEATAIELVIRGTEIRCEANDKSLHCLGRQMPVEPVNGRIDLRILVDRVSLEIFGNQGRKTLTICFLPEPNARPLQLFAVGGVGRITTMDIHELRSAWPA